MMIVKELIAQLKEMPQNAIVELEILDIPDNCYCDNIEEIFETANNKVCIQAYNF